MVRPGLLMIGDSQVKYAHLTTQCQNDFEVTVFSVSGMRVEEVSASMVEATKFFYHVVIHLGTNNLICGKLHRIL